MSDNQQKHNDAVAEAKVQRHRSPNHPAINLQEAIAKTALLHGKYGRHHVTLAHASELWGYKANSSVAFQCVAALKSYGLAESTRSGKSRKIAVSEAGDRIVRSAPDRRELVKTAAMAPTIHRELMDEFKEKGLPPHEILRQYLVWERPTGKFNDDSVDGFIERFRETLEYAELFSESKINGSGSPHEVRPPACPNVGDFVQWTSDGIDQLSIPQRLLGISEDGFWAFLEELDEGVPMSEIVAADPPLGAREEESGTGTSPRNPFYKPPKTPGPFISFPLGEDNTLELRLQRRVSAKDFERLKKLIELSEDSLVQENVD